MKQEKESPLPANQSGVRPLALLTVKIPLVGRDRELSVIDGCMQVLREGQGTLILVEGTTGIGKSELMRTVSTQAGKGGITLTAGRCYERGITPPYGPWREILGQLAAKYTESTPSLPEALGGQAPAFSFNELAELACGYLRKVGSVNPVLVLLDDIHWADQESLDLLEHITRRLDRTAALIVAAYRAEEIDRGSLAHLLPPLQRDRPVTKIALTPLDEAAARQLVGCCGLDSAPALADYLYQRSGGIPLYLIELLKDWLERNRLAPTEDGQWLPPEEGVPVPTFLEQIFTQRIVRLHPDVAELLEVAAVVGEAWPLAVVEGVLGWPEDRLLGALEAALDASLLRDITGPDERYRFAHGLIQEMLYTKLIHRHRRRLHGRVASILEDERNAAYKSDESLAYHYTAAGYWPQATTYNIAAADAAHQQYANHAALKLYRQAAEALARDPMAADLATCVALYCKKGDAHMVLNQKDEAKAAFSQMLKTAQAAGDAVAECRALCALSTINQWQYRFSEAHRNAKGALALAEKSESPEAIVATHLNYAHLSIVEGHLLKAFPHVEAVERLAIGDAWRRERGRGMYLAALLAIFRGDYEMAQGYSSQAGDLAHESRDFLAMGGSSFGLGLALGEQAKYTQARLALQAGLKAAEDSGEIHYYAKLQNLMGWLHNLVGDYEAALRWNQQALESSRRVDVRGIIEAECYSLLNIATDELSLGHIARAEQRLSEFEALLPRAQYSRWRYFNRYLLFLAELALANDEAEVAQKWAREAYDFASMHNACKNMARSKLLEGRALLTLHKPEATEPLREALQRADEITHPVLRWQTRLYLYQALAASGENAASLITEANQQLQAILTEIDDIHWKTCLEATEPVQQLRAAGSTTENRTEKESPTGLTLREVEVLRWVADGATNQMIARKLYISVKTVNTHVRSILRKTQSDNRAAAAAFAVRHELIMPKS